MNKIKNWINSFAWMQWLNATTIGKWCNSLSWQGTLFCVLFMALSGAVSLYRPFIGLLLFLVALASMNRKARNARLHELLTLVLITQLCFGGGSQTKAEPVAKPQVQECNLIIIGSAALIVAGVILYQVVKFCKAHFPPPGGAAPPPATPQPAPPSTNHNNSAFGTRPLAAAPALPLINVVYDTPNNLSGYDISSYGWIDHTDTNNPVIFQDYFTLQVDASPDLVNWTNYCTVQVYLSTKSLECVTYDGSGKPYGTNWWVGNPYTTALTNSLSFPLIDPKQQKMFFKPATY